MRGQVFLRNGFNAKFLLPGLKYFWGGAMIKSAVNFTAASHAAPLDIEHFIFPKTHSLAAVPIFLHHLFSEKGLAGFKFMIRPFFDKKHIAPCLGKQARRN